LELVSTLAKNSAKLNPFEIMILQTTRKENNWKTEESCNFGDGTDQMVQSLMFMFMMMMMMRNKGIRKFVFVKEMPCVISGFRRGVKLPNYTV